MTLTCDVGTQTYPLVLAPNGPPPPPSHHPHHHAGYDVDHPTATINPPSTMMTYSYSNGNAIFSPNKSEAAFALSSLFRSGDDSNGQPPFAAAATTTAVTMTSWNSSNDSTPSLRSSSPQSTTTTSPILLTTTTTAVGPSGMMRSGHGGMDMAYQQQQQQQQQQPTPPQNHQNYNYNHQNYHHHGNHHHYHHQQQQQQHPPSLGNVNHHALTTTSSSTSTPPPPHPPHGNYAAPPFMTAPGGNFCHHHPHPHPHPHHGPPGPTMKHKNDANANWGSPCCCHFPYNATIGNGNGNPNNQTPNGSNSNNTTNWESLPSRVSPGQYHPSNNATYNNHNSNPNNNSNSNPTHSDERRNASKWNQESAMKPPTPNHQHHHHHLWNSSSQQAPSSVSATATATTTAAGPNPRNPMQVILEAARFAPSPVVSSNNKNNNNRIGGGGFRARCDEGGKRLRDISNDQSMVTPTPIPKKPRSMGGGVATDSIHQDVTTTTSTTTSPSQQVYSRKNKSLGALAESFVTKYESSPAGTNIVIDDTAIEFQVERRRIYDIIAILESLEFITRRHKNTYSWNGRDKLNEFLGRLQAEAIATWPDVAKTAGLLDPLTTTDVVNKPVDKECSPHEHKSLGRLTQTYLKLFLVGHKPLSLPDASDIIHGAGEDDEAAATAKPASSDAAALAKLVAGRVLKTRIRRLYDIANCASRIGFLRKVDSEDSRRPKFAWAYALSPLEIQQLYQSGGSEGGDDEASSHPSSPSEFAATKDSLPHEADQVVDVVTCSGKASPPLAEDRLFLSQIHQRGAEDDDAAIHNKPKALSWNEPVSHHQHHQYNSDPSNGDGVGPRTVSIMSSDWDGIVAEHHHGHGDHAGSHFYHDHHRQQRNPNQSTSSPPLWEDDHHNSVHHPSHHPNPFGSATAIITSTARMNRDGFSSNSDMI